MHIARNQNLPSTTGKFAKKDDSAGGVAFITSSTDGVVPDSPNPTTELDNRFETGPIGYGVVPEIPASIMKRSVSDNK